MTDQVWKEIPGYPGYFASNLGSIIGKRGRVLRPAFDRYGYLYYIATTPETRRTLKGHRAVALAFIGDIPRGSQVNHKNGILHDNRADNLEIVSARQNILHSFGVLGRKYARTQWHRGEQHGRAKLTEASVREIRSSYELGVTQAKLAEKFGVAQDTISQIARRRTWTHVSP